MKLVVERRKILILSWLGRLFLVLLRKLGFWRFWRILMNMFIVWVECFIVCIGVGRSWYLGKVIRDGFYGFVFGGNVYFCNNVCFFLVSLFFFELGIVMFFIDLFLLWGIYCLIFIFVILICGFIMWGICI